MKEDKEEIEEVKISDEQSQEKGQQEKEKNKSLEETQNEKNEKEEEKEDVEQEQKEENNGEEKDEKKEKDENREQEEKKYNNYEEVYKKEKKSYIKPLIAIFGFLIIFTIFSTIFAILNINSDKIISGVSIEGIDVSGMTKDEAKAKIEEVFKPKEEKEIPVKYNEYESTIDPKAIEVKYDISKALDEAHTFGRSGNIFVNNYEILGTLIKKPNVEVQVNLNEEIVKKTINDIGANLPGIVEQSSYYIEEDELIITKGKEGIVIKTDDLLQKVYVVLDDLNYNQEPIEIPVETKQPDPVDVDKIHQEVYKEPKDAYFTKEPFQIFPEVDGVDFNVEEVKNLLNEEKEEYVIKLKITNPEISIDELGEEAFPDQLATFTTKYDASNTNRTTNLRLASNKINGKVILPGEEFSYNKVVGARTIAAGYKEAKIYSNGEVVDGLGGGICQISSTLYNTVVMANLEITDRRNHQFVTSYVPAGRDATVVYGSQDFRFKNTRTYPVRIQSSVNNGVARISIYGLKEETEYKISFSTKTISAIPYSTKYVDDPTLPAGQERVKQKGANGLVTQTYKIVSQNGKVVSRDLLSKDTYRAMQKIVARGTKQ